MNNRKLVPRWVAASALVVGLIGGGYGLANAASGTGGTSSGTTTTTAGNGADRQRGNETALTGDTLASVTKAALAKVPGGKVIRAETDAEGNAAYEVHMTNASGALVTVYVDKSFGVVSVDTDARAGGHHGHGGGPRGDETALTGDTLSKATAAALAKVPGGSVLRAETDADGGSAYEVHMTNASGSYVTVHLDKNFAVVSVDTSTHNGGPVD